MKIKCDRCETAIGLYRHKNGHRCSQCIWDERENLIAWVKDVLSNGKVYDSTHEKQTMLVDRKKMDALAEVVKEVTS